MSWTSGKVAVALLLLAAAAFASADVVASQAWPGGSTASVAAQQTMTVPASAATVPASAAQAAAAPALPDFAAKADRAAEPPQDSSRLAQINWLLNGDRWLLDGSGPATSSPLADQTAVPGRPWATGQTQDRVPDLVTELPPAPSSLALVLSAVASLGAYQGVRSLKRLHLGAGLSHLPDWYHADAVQVGHATPIQLEFHLSALPACVFAAPAAERPVVFSRLPRELRSRLRAQFTLLIESPRGPPF